MISYNINVHADDYAISPSSDADVIALCKAGKLDSISVMPNMDICEKACKTFLVEKENFPKKVNVSIHLNFVEGKCVSPRDKVSHLVNEKSFFTVTWLKLLVWSYNPFVRKKIRAELACEIVSQTERMVSLGMMSCSAIRFDSHQHTHMTPIVFDALLDAVTKLEKNNYKVEYIRCSEDPILPYFFCREIYKTFSPVNILKCLILNFFSKRVKRSLARLNLPATFLCGVFFSDCMNVERLNKVLPLLEKKAEKEKRPFEVLFHPGTMLASELTEEIVFKKAHTSKNRHVEYDAVMQLDIHHNL